MVNLENKQYQFDFIKGIAIICVILLHAFGSFNDTILSAYGIGQAVPLFITVSCVLGYLSLEKNNSLKHYFKMDRLKKLFKRIFLPFFIVQILMIIPYLVKSNFNPKEFIISGGYGPGSYYPWLYLQLWVVLPFMYLLMKKSPLLGILITLVFMTLCDSMFSLAFPKKWLYRLFVGRYLFICILTYLILKNKLAYKYVLVFAVIGSGMVFIHKYKGINLEPVVFTAWSGERFFNHFYTMVIFMFLYKIYEYIPKSFSRIICIIGYYSWEIFLAQMAYFTFNGYIGINWYVNVLFSLFICIVPICTYEFMKRPMELDNTHRHCT